MMQDSREGALLMVKPFEVEGNGDRRSLEKRKCHFSQLIDAEGNSKYFGDVIIKLDTRDAGNFFYYFYTSSQI